MPEPNEPEVRTPRANDPLDEHLAAFADQVLAGSVTDQDPVLSDQPGMRLLQSTVLHLHRSLPDLTISEAMSRRMRSRLAAHWAKEGPKPQTASLWARLRAWLLPERQGWQSSRALQRAWALRTVAVALVVILAVVVVFSPTLGDGLTGTAGLEGGSAPLAILAVFVVGVAAWWWISRRRKP